MLRFHVFCGLLCLFVCSGCIGTKGVNIPQQRLLSPENTGDSLSGRVGLVMANYSRITLINDSLFLNPDTPYEEPSITTIAYPFIQGELSILKPLSLSFGPDGFGMKLQVSGNATQDARAGDVPIALVVSTGSYRESGDSAEAKADWVSYGLLAGYRKTSNVLWYGGANMTPYHATGHYQGKKVGATSDTPYEQQELPKRSGNIMSGTVGVQYNSAHFYCALEAVGAKSTFTGAGSHIDYSLGGNLGLMW